MALGFQNPTKNAPLTQVTAPALQGPTTRQVSADETVSGQMNKILASNSPLLQRAKTRAAQAANSRGLLNSSMGVQAGEEAVLTTALPMAQQDAATYNKQGLTNQGAQNQFATAANKYGTDTAKNQQQFGNQFQLSNQNFEQQTGTGGYAGNGLIGTNLKSQLELQKSAQDFNASEAALGRTQQTALQSGQQGFASGEAALGRAQQTALQTGQQGFASGESALGRAQQTSETALGRAQQVSESALGRAQQTSETALGRAQQTSESALGRTQQSALQTGQQTFATDEAALNRTQQTKMLSDQHKNSVATAKTLDEYQTANITLQDTLQTAMTELGQTNSLELTRLNADLAAGELDAQVYANTRGAYLQSVSELVRQSQITVGELQVKEGISAADKKLMLADQATLLTTHLAAQKTLYSAAATWTSGWATLPTDGLNEVTA